MKTRLRLRSMALRVACIFCGALSAAAVAQPAAKPVPLPSYRAIMAEIEAIAQRSDRVLVEAARSTAGEGRLVYVSAPRNLARLAAIEAGAQRLAHPWNQSAADLEARLSDSPLVLSVTAGVHPREPSSTFGIPSLVRWLAATKDEAWARRLDRTLIVIDPCLDPQGHDALSAWWAEVDEDPRTRACPPPEPIHRYAGRDLNRDWLWATQPETRRTITGLWRRWYPQVLIDRHEMPDRDAQGMARPRLFIPPFKEPQELHLHSYQLAGLHRLGAEVRRRLWDDGHTGIVSRMLYDGWSPARAAPMYFGSLRFLIEVAHAPRAAKVRAARPNRSAARSAATKGRPWPGGAWSFGDSVALANDATRHALAAAADDRERILKHFVRIRREQAQAGPAGGWILARRGGDAAMVARLLDLFRVHGVTVRETAAELQVQGRAWPAGSLYLPAPQPAATWLQAIMNPVPYPEVDAPPYDITSHALSLWFGAAWQSIDQPHDIATRAVALTPRWHVKDWWAKTEPAAVRDTGLLGAFARAAAHSRATTGDQPPALRVARMRSAAAHADEGWMHWMLDQAGITHFALSAASPLPGGGNFAAQLQRANLLIVPDIPAMTLRRGPTGSRWPQGRRGGLGREGAHALATWIEAGGTAIFCGRSTDWARSSLRANLRPAVLGEAIPAIFGAHLRARAATAHPFAAGQPRDLPFLWHNARAFRLEEDSIARPIWVLDHRELLLSGAARNTAGLRGAVLALSIKRGRGRIILLGGSPAFRGGLWPALPAFLNALLSPLNLPRENR